MRSFTKIKKPFLSETVLRGPVKSKQNRFKLDHRTLNTVRKDLVHRNLLGALLVAQRQICALQCIVNINRCRNETSKMTSHRQCDTLCTDFSYFGGLSE